LKFPVPEKLGALKGWLDDKPCPSVNDVFSSHDYVQQQGGQRSSLSTQTHEILEWRDLPVNFAICEGQWASKLKSRAIRYIRYLAALLQIHLKRVTVKRIPNLPP
jgi:hypothetical protein